MRNRGFTLIELLVVISIIGVIASIVLVSFSGSRDKAKLAKGQHFDAQISHALGAYAVGIWRFEEGGGATAHDGSGLGNNGTLHGSANFVVNNDLGGYAIDLDGQDDGVNILNKNFVGITDFTMCAWIYIKGTHKHYDGAIISSGDWNVNHWAFSILQNNNGIRTRGPHESINYSFGLNKWYFVVVSREVSTLYYYVNGEKIGEDPCSSSALVSNASNTMLGRETYAGGYFAFNGQIDNVRIYEQSMSVSQIQQHYAEGAAKHGIALK